MSEHQNGHDGGQVAVQDTPSDASTEAKPRATRTAKEPAAKYDGPAFDDLAIEHQKAITPAVLDLLAVLAATNGTAQRELTKLAGDPAQPLAVRLLPAALATPPAARNAVMKMARNAAKGAK